MTSRIASVVVLAGIMSMPRPAEASQPALLIILAGGKTAPEAEKAKREWLETGGWHPLVARSGWPRVMSSDGVPGLKPGFYLAALGVCPLAQAATATYARTTKDGAYSRRVEWSQPMACPELAPGLSIERAGSLEGPEGRLVVSRVIKESISQSVTQRNVMAVTLELAESDGTFAEERLLDFHAAFRRSGLDGKHPDHVRLQRAEIVEDRLEVELELDAKCMAAHMVGAGRLRGQKLVMEWEPKGDTEASCDGE